MATPAAPLHGFPPLGLAAKRESRRERRRVGIAGRIIGACSITVLAIAGLAGHLQGRKGMFLNGIVLVSSILNFQTARFDRGNDLAHVLLLPSCTATAWYHGRLDQELQEDFRRTLDEVEQFALTDYAPALLRGSDLPDDDRSEIARQLARYTGLSVEYIEQTNLRLTTRRFTKQLMRHKRRTVGRLDSRFTGIDADAAGDGFEYDPSYAAIQGPYTAMLSHYLRAELEYENDLPYEILTGRVHPWNYNNVQNRYLNVAETLREAMTRNPSLRTFVASGVSDAPAIAEWCDPNPNDAVCRGKALVLSGRQSRPATGRSSR